MTKAQLIVVWIVGLLLSGVLVFIGIGQPYLAKEKASSNRIRVASLLPSVSEIQNTGGPPEYIRIMEEIRVRRLKAQTPNYYIGVIAPVVILGGCAFLTTLRKKESE